MASMLTDSVCKFEESYLEIKPRRQIGRRFQKGVLCRAHIQNLSVKCVIQDDPVKENNVCAIVLPSMPIGIEAAQLYLCSCSIPAHTQKA